MSAHTANRLNHFIQKHQTLWNRLEYLYDQTKKKEVTRQTLDELGHTYRQVTAHLAYAQTYFPTHPVTQYLNNLTTKAHQAIYGYNPKSDIRKWVRFFTHRFPELFYDRSLFFLTAAFLFIAGALFAYGYTMVTPENATAFVPPEVVDQIDPDQVGVNQWDHTVVSSQIMINNIQVAFLCFAFGALFGIGTVWVLFSNGLLIGALAALFQQAGGAYIFWAFIWPHGVIELTAIFISGAAGLSLAYSFFVPGELPRLESFKREGRVTVQIILGVIPLFIVAGLIEGFLTPAPWPHWTKYLIALSTLVFLTYYLGRPFLNKGILKNVPGYSPAPQSIKDVSHV
ncbi:stage II sporulation protein M [Kroppenstedtia pulmonis]|uniref:Stage II sporulation protein M n=1 Tax=Kroppenstedtia pulmonis TaxID=1380685 RepID=A0A7D4BPY4_9BACL|nr:stage II sporulation protein M [Kroppenstedtia pulmonis]QKG84431.1 stage II sporulation protein M [Kroppenstedtia pulmonis]